MHSSRRRRFLQLLAAAPALLVLPNAHALDCTVEHPFRPPKDAYQGQCPVCGMVRPMWARTWISFDEWDGLSQVCSFHCLADWILKSGRKPAHVMLSLYHHPERSIPAEAAFIVMGSAAAGTMSPISKIVFAERSLAEAFAGNCGGRVVGFAEALAAAKTNVAGENRMINARRLETGKIVEPADGDHCPVCNMIPARYPYGKCQIAAKDGRTLHFCSTQCLFAFLGKQAQYVDTPVVPLLIWVVDRNAGLWISGRAAFYVIGSQKVFGPMGYEALPFNSAQEAEAFAAENGGQTTIFSEIAIQDVVPGWQY